MNYIKYWLISHSVFIVFENGDIYSINKYNLSRKKVNEIPEDSIKTPTKVFYKKDFDLTKSLSMDVKNLSRLSLDDARNYRNIGFLSNKEFKNYSKTFYMKRGE